MGGDNAVRPAARARATAGSKPSVPLKTKTTFTSSGVKTTFTSSTITTRFTSSSISTRFTSSVPDNARYKKANAFLADPARMRGEKIYLLKKLMREGVVAQRLALVHLAKPAWINYLKCHDNKLVRRIEKLAQAKPVTEQGRHVTLQERMLWAANQRRAKMIWKTIAADVRHLRMKAYISARCDFHDRTLNKLNKRGIERLFKSVKSFRPPRECRL